MKKLSLLITPNAMDIINTYPSITTDSFAEKLPNSYLFENSEIDLVNAISETATINYNEHFGDDEIFVSLVIVAKHWDENADQTPIIMELEEGKTFEFLRHSLHNNSNTHGGGNIFFIPKKNLQELSSVEDDKGNLEKSYLELVTDLQPIAIMDAKKSWDEIEIELFTK